MLNRTVEYSDIFEYKRQMWLEIKTNRSDTNEKQTYETTLNLRGFKIRQLHIPTLQNRTCLVSLNQWGRLINGTKRKLKICKSYFSVKFVNKMDIFATKVVLCERIFRRGKRLLRISVTLIFKVVWRFQLATSESLQNS